MNFVVKLNTWLETNGLIHTSTTYNLYSDKELTTLIDTITDSDKLFLSLNTDIPIGTTYYVVATRHFNIENIDYESEVFEITNYGDVINNMILSEPVIVGKPDIVISKKAIAESIDTFTLKTSAYRGTGDGHTHTHWFVYDANGLLFIKLRDIDNKTSIEIPKTLVYGKNKVTFKAIHCSNNIESATGSYTVNFNKVNFEINTQLYNVPLADYVVTFKKVDITKPMRLARVHLLNSYNEIIKIYNITEVASDINTIIIPEDIIISNAVIGLEIYCYDESNTITKINRNIYPVQNSLENQYNLNYKYLNNIEVHNDFANIASTNSVGDIVNGLVWLPTDNTIGKYLVDTAGQFTLVGVLNGVTLLNTAETDTYIHYSNGYLIVDTYAEGLPTFMVYKHDLNHDVFTLLHMLTRIEDGTVAKTNNILQMTLDEFIYNPYGSNKLVKYNFKTNTLTELNPIPMNITSSVLIKLENGRILVIGNESHLTKIYRPEENDYINSVSIVPANFIGKDLKAVELINKDSLIFINNGIDSGILHFDRSTYTLSPTDLSLSDTSINTVVPMNGKVALLGVVDIDYVNSIPKHTIINFYN